MKENKHWYKKKGVFAKINEAFKNASDQRAYDRKSQSSILKRLINQSIIKDFEGLDHLETADIQVIDPIARQRIRMNNRKNKKILERYFNKSFDLIKFCKLLLGSYIHSIGLGQNLVVIAQVMKLTCLTLEYGLWKIVDARKLIKVFFLRTEQLHKQEEYINQKRKGFDNSIYEYLMICKEYSACILVQIITLVNDEWLYHKATTKQEVGILEGFEKFKSKLQAVVSRGVKYPLSDYVMFNQDPHYYNLFSFVMFNYLLYTLKKDGKILSTWKYRRAMHHLFMYVYDYHNEPFGLSTKLLKSDYLAYYLTETIEEDYILEGEKLAVDLKSMIGEYKVMRTSEVNILDNSGILKQDTKDADSSVFNSGINEASLEKKTGDLFTRLEVLIGLQDETYATRLMITEKTVPFLLVNLLDEIHLTLKGEMAEEVFVRGLKILFQLTKGNYLAQAQITVGPAWSHINTMIQGENGVLTLIYLSELFSRDNLFLHINETFTYMLIDKFREDFRVFFKSFMKEKSTNAKDLVYLFMFQRLLSILIKDNGIEQRIKKPYNLTIAKYLHVMMHKFALPLLRDNKLEASECYEPKLIKKNWNFENCFSLSALMMLSGDHIRSMLMDFALSLLKLYNACCKSFYPGDFSIDIEKELPDDLSCFDYLLEFPEGVIFKSEILVTYCNFKIFANCSRIQGKYTKIELSQNREDTMEHYVSPKHLKEIPELIESELQKFSRLDLTNFEQEDLIDYLLRGICQMTYKYCKGVQWYSSCCNNDETMDQFTTHLHRINTALFKVRQQVQHMKERKLQNPNRIGSVTTFKNYSMNELLSTTIQPLIHSLNLMFEGSRYQHILARYELQEKFKDKSEMKTVNHLLTSEASFISSKDFTVSGPATEIKVEFEDTLKEKENPLSAKMNALIKHYQQVKLSYIKDFKKNLFFKVLQSKMEDNNQRNMISYIVSSLSTIQLDVGSRHSLWQDRNSLALLIFINNSLFWCSKTRKALYNYLNKNKEQMDRLISAVYKGMRDSFTMLAFSPFDNDNWEYIWSKFYIFSSFIQGLCKENCQEFKKYLGNFQPALGCEVHKNRKLTLLDDLQSLLLKYMMFSGLSKNKNPNIIPSDKISIIPTLSRLMRCIIEMQTGPCRPNQLKTYSAGTQIWLNLLTRVIRDFDSEYYHLVNITLDYILSLLEGNNKVILKFYAAAFDIPMMYSLMAELIISLRDIVLIRYYASSKSSRKKRSLKDKRSNRVFNSEVKRKPRGAKVAGKGSKAINNLEDFRNKLNNSEEDEDDGDKSTRSIIEDNEASAFLNHGSEKVNWNEDKEMTNWDDLIEMYKTDAFEGHIALICSIKIFRFLNRVAYTSRKYQIFFDKKERELEEKFAEFGFKIEEIQTGQAKLTGKANTDDELIVYYFMKEITSKIEILDNQNEQEIFIFPKPPCCFYLKQKTIRDFHETCNIENTEAKLSDMFENFNEFHKEMKSYQEFRAKNPIFSSFTTDNAFKLAQIFSWFLSLVINFIYLFQMEYRDFEYYMPNFNIKTAISILTSVLISLSGFMSVCWFITNYKIVYINQLSRFKKKNPYKNSNSIINFLRISVLKSIGTQPEVMSFLLHILLGCMGLGINPIFQVRLQITP